MRRDDDVLHAVERRIGRQRLVVEGVEDGAAKRPVVEGPEQRPFVDEAAARDVDEPRPGLDHREGLGVDHLAGLGRQRRGQDDEVGLGEELRQASPVRRRGPASARRTSGPRHPRPRRSGSSCRRRSAGGPPRPDTRTRSRAPRPPGRSNPGPTIPTVTSRSSAPSSGCHVRSRWSSRSWGSLRLTEQDHHQDVLGDRPAEDAASVGHDQAAFARGRRQRPVHARGRRVDPRQVRRADQQAIEGVGGQPAPEHDLDIVERAVGQALDGDGDEASPGRRGPDPLEVARAIASRQDRAEGDRRRGATGSAARDRRSG